MYELLEQKYKECFADQKIYLAITDSIFISNEHFAVDSETGEITARDDYEGTNIIFEIVYLCLIES